MDDGPTQAAEPTLAELIDKAAAGEEILLRRDGVVVAKIVPWREPAKVRRQPGALKGLFTVGPEFFDPLPEEETRGLG